MPSIPEEMNNVRFEFHENVNREINPKLLTALAKIVRPGVPWKYLVRVLFIRSASDSHVMPSRHAQAKAVDISRINGHRIFGSYGHDPEITQIVKRIQTEWEKVPGRRENYGPYLKLKSGRPHRVSGHADHIHLSID